ncbi:DUF4232 domain-containing protein [Streptomyces sp. KL116D]|uniref:DUF4232 domain-containing protein n=1 Tax=Streptomyces sp. KL116D TaxID=3045152 RepID=UPI003556E2FC
MFRKRTRSTVLAAVGLAAALSLTACDNGDDATPPSPADSPTASAPASPADSTGGPTGSATGGTGTTTGAKSALCTTANLTVTAVDNTVEGDTQGVVTVQLANKGPKCRIHGFPGADLKTSAGTVSLPRSGERAYPADLATGASAAFNISFPVNDSGGSGVRPTQIVVTPPDETHSATVAWPAGTLPVTDGGDSGKLTVGPANRVG